MKQISPESVQGRTFILPWIHRLSEIDLKENNSNFSFLLEIELARGGVGLIKAGTAYISREGRWGKNTTGMDNNRLGVTGE
jgi:hypothetical protein